MSGDATAPQQRNMAVCSQLHEVHRALLAQVPKLPPAAAEVLCDALEHVQVRACRASCVTSFLSVQSPRNATVVVCLSCSSLEHIQVWAPLGP